MTKRIKFFSSFCSSENCKEVYERLYGKYDDIIVTTGDDYNFAIIINTAMPILKIDKKNVIGLAFEPNNYLGLTPQFIEYAKKYIGKYYIGDKSLLSNDLPEPFIEHYAFMWHTTPLKSIPIKNSLMSIMISQKLNAPGHKYRHKLTQEIIKRNLPIDIYGRGCKYHKSQYLKGEFKEIEPYESYHFHIAIENFQTNAYFSEKITNPLLCSTQPIYLGCNTIDNYFPNMVTHLSGDIMKDIVMIEDILKNPEKYKKEINIMSVKQTINLFNHLM